MTPPLLAVTVTPPNEHGDVAACVIDIGTDDVLLRADRRTPRHVTDALTDLEHTRSPRWTWWGHETAVAVARLGLRPARCRDLSATHRLLFGGWRAGPGHAWALAHGLDSSRLPVVRPPDLFSSIEQHDPERPIRDDGFLDPEWVDGSWADSTERIEHWTRLAVEVHRRQAELIAAVPDRPTLGSTANAESTASALAAELEVTGLPIDLQIADDLVAGFIGPRPTSPDEERRMIAERDERVLRHVPDGASYDLRSPEQVKSLLRRCGIEVPDTRSWRLERLVDQHPVVQPLLDWRRAERIATTFGYGWLDEHVRTITTTDGRGRLHGSWSSSDGAAGRMTASAGLHNMPAELRPAITPEPGHRFVRADLGQIEPRILATVAADEQLARATHDDDMYAPVAARLRVEREVAKVAVLGAMYGQTTGVGAEALRGLERAYPTAMGFLSAADRAAQGGNDLRTVGGRLVRMSGDDAALDDASARSRAAARGRYGRNAMIQGAAAEFFKVWALLVRARAAPLGGEIVLCLHDELLVHAPADHAAEVAEVVDAALAEAAARWVPASAPAVRFVADTSVIDRWSDAK